MSQISFDFQERAAKPSFGAALTEAQAKIRDFDGANLVVVAGAGTGKTEALTQRVLRLLVRGDGTKAGPVPLDGVLALTFTDKAAAEMRARVYGGLVRALRNCSDERERERLETLRADFGARNRILTFDALNRRLLSLFPEKSALSPTQTLLGDADRFRMRADLTRAFWDRCEAFDAAQKSDLWEFLARFPSRSAALEAIATLAQTERAPTLDRLRHLPIEDAYACEIECLVADFERRTQQAHEKNERIAWRNLERALRNWPDLPPLVAQKLRDPEALLQSGAKGVVTQSGGWSVSFSKLLPFELSSRFTREILPFVVAWRELAQGQPAQIERDERAKTVEYASRRAVAFLAGHALWWQAQRKRWCETHALADFSDIAEAALALVQNPDVAKTLQKTLRVILIDEFQDTNAAQWALIDAIRDKKRGNVLIVGDEKQAIYGFRGGDMTVFDRVRRLLLDGREAHELRESHRSTRALVEWTNAVFERVLPAPAEREIYEAPFQALVSMRAEEPAQPVSQGLWKLVAGTWLSPAETESLGKTEQPALATARFLRQLCDDAARLARAENSPSENAPVALAHPEFAHIARLIAAGAPAIGLLFSSHKVKAEFEAALRSLEVPFTSVKGIGFFQSDPVCWTLHLLGVLLDASDFASWVGLARSPLGGLSDVAVFEKKLGVSHSREADACAAQLLENRLESWREMARVLPFSDLLESVLNETELAFYEAGFGDFAQREANWRKLLDLIRTRESQGLGGLRDLLDFLRPLWKDSTREADAALPSDGSIALLTAHGAKGLGFPMVIVAQTDASTRTESPNFLRGEIGGEAFYAFRMSDFDLENEDEAKDKEQPPLLYQILREERKKRAVAEFKRLFYVACTRARDTTVFVWPVNKTGQPAKGCWADWMGLCAQNLHTLQPSALETPPLSDAAPQTQTIAVEPAPYQLRWREEIGLDEWLAAHGHAEKTEAPHEPAKQRAWLETWGREHGESLEIRENLPFCVAASALEIEGASWVFGAFDWLARCENGEVVLLCSSSPKRRELLEKAAREAGFSLRAVLEFE